MAACHDALAAAVAASEAFLDNMLAPAASETSLTIEPALVSPQRRISAPIQQQQQTFSLSSPAQEGVPSGHVGYDTQP